jgi:ribonuclease D
MAILRSLAEWREGAAQKRDIPRSRILKDEAILEIAANAPQSIDDLGRVRALGRSVAEGRLGNEILEAVNRGIALQHQTPAEEDPRGEMPPGLGPLVDLLRVLLKLRCEQHEVAQKLVANAAEIFGKDALALKHGKLGLTAQGKRILVVDL